MPELVAVPGQEWAVGQDREARGLGRHADHCGLALAEVRLGVAVDHDTAADVTRARDDAHLVAATEDQRAAVERVRRDERDDDRVDAHSITEPPAERL